MAGAAALVFLVALVELGSPLHGMPDDTGFVPDCGSALRPLLPAGGEGNVYAEECAGEQDSRRLLASPFLILGGAVLVISATSIRRTTVLEQADPTSAMTPRSQTAINPL